jgi:hypothetical protein
MDFGELEIFGKWGDGNWEKDMDHRSCLAIAFRSIHTQFNRIYKLETFLKSK